MVITWIYSSSIYGSPESRPYGTNYVLGLNMLLLIEKEVIFTNL